MKNKKGFKELVNKTQIQTNLGFSVLLNVLFLSLFVFGEIGVVVAFLGLIIIRVVEEKKNDN